MITGKAPGKIILSGEHAVVYGIPGIAFPVFDCNATTEITENNKTDINEDYVCINAPQLNETFNLDFSRSEQNPLELTVINFLKRFNLPIKNIELKIDSKIPIASGMGSGAAISTSMIRALGDLYNIHLSNEEIFNQVLEIEKIYHGNPSGIDPKVIVYETPFYFIKNQKMEIINVKSNFVIAIIDSKIKSSTKKVVEWVGKQRLENPEKYNNIFNKIGDITENLKNALQGNDIGLIGNLLSQNHYYLQEMGVSNSELDNIVSLSNRAGAEGSKMSGAGWGGIVISVLKPENVENFILEMKKSGIEDIFTSPSPLQRGI